MCQQVLDTPPEQVKWEQGWIGVGTRPDNGWWGKFLVSAEHTKIFSSFFWPDATPEASQSTETC